MALPTVRQLTAAEVSCSHIGFSIFRRRDTCISIETDYWVGTIGILNLQERTCNTMMLNM